MDTDILLSSLLDMVLASDFSPKLRAMLVAKLAKLDTPTAELKDVAAREAAVIPPSPATVTMPVVKAAPAVQGLPRLTESIVRDSKLKRADLIKLIKTYGLPIIDDKQGAAELRTLIMEFVNAGYKTPEPVLFESAPVEPVVEPTPEPVVEAAPAPVVEPVVEPVIEPAPEPVIEPAPEPVVEPAPEPAVEPVAEPAVEAAPEPVVEPVAAPAARLSVADRTADMIAYVKNYVATGANGKLPEYADKQKWLVTGAVSPIQAHAASELGAFMARPDVRNEVSVQKFWRHVGCTGNCMTCPHTTAQAVVCMTYFDDAAVGRDGKQFLTVEEILDGDGNCWIVDPTVPPEQAGRATYIKKFKRELRELK